MKIHFAYYNQFKNGIDIAFADNTLLFLSCVEAEKELHALNSHPAVLDGFIDLVREEQQRSRTQREKLEPSRPSVRDKLKQELPANKSAAPKKRELER